ncbi:MAG: ATPase [Bacteroidetes bacterium]|nr:MAG: ATPase [Bacteroidota bacterium]
MNVKHPILVTKLSGEKVPFDAEKLRNSLRRAGASEADVAQIESKIEDFITPGMSTKAIYRKAFALLKKHAAHFAAKYKLKRAIYELGPSGFPFEKFIGAILRASGYAVQVGQIVQGACVQHEVDVIAQKDHQHFMIECKFHSDQRRKCDVKVPLYIHARFLDVEKMWKAQPGHDHKFHQGWVVTNTRFTTDAIQYGLCAGMHLISWDFPAKGSLRDRIDQLKLYPVTTLTTLTKSEKQAILEKGIVLCKELIQNEWLLDEWGLSNARKKRIMDECHQLCATSGH